MTNRRQPNPPPELPGYTYSRLLGLGGFADVFVYRQHLPAREVAVKVLTASALEGPARDRFVTEANLMAQVSQHPAIVTVHHADFAADGRAYLVMEYCQRPGLSQRYRTERISVAECLRIGIRLASAVQAAHDAGILHRDIKPANVLTTDFGWPALTDFGIAAATGQTDVAVGMSIPWAPPELIRPEPTGDERADIYSLASTIYSVLAGRSPFEVPGAANTASELIGRIERMPLPRLGRPDIPDELYNVLVRAMSRNPENRYPTAVAFARALQRVEMLMGAPVTPLDVRDEHSSSPIVHLADDSTRVRPVAASAMGFEDEHPGPMGSARITVDGDVSAASSGRRAVIAAAGVLLAIVVGVFVWMNRDFVSQPVPSDTGVQQPTVTTMTVVPQVQDVVGVRNDDGSVTVTWVNPEPEPGDRYLWAVVDPTQELLERHMVTDPAINISDLGAHEVCVQIWLGRADGRVSNRPVVECVQ